MTLPERVFGGSAMNIYAFLPINPLFHASKTRTPGKPTGAPEICISLDQRWHLNRMLRFWAQWERATAFSPSLAILDKVRAIR